MVWFTGDTYPDPLGPYETKLKAFLDGGGRLFISGQDILDQAAGTTDFFHDYVHVNWDGTETQNDKPTDNVTGVTGNPVTNGIGTVPIDHSVLGATFEDQITPTAPGDGGLHRRHRPDRRSDRRTPAPTRSSSSPSRSRSTARRPRRRTSWPAS